MRVTLKFERVPKQVKLRRSEAKMLRRSARKLREAVFAYYSVTPTADHVRLAAAGDVGYQALSLSRWLGVSVDDAATVAEVAFRMDQRAEHLEDPC